MAIKESKRGVWENAMAQLQLNKFQAQCSKYKITKLLKKLNSDKIRITEFVRPNIVVFEKKDCSYDFAGKNFEKWLFDNFKLKKKGGDKK